MYTLGEQVTHSHLTVVEILDPDGDFICYVDLANAEALLSHLNKQ